MWYIYTMEYYSAIRKDEILPFATMWMDLENIMLSKINQMEKQSRSTWFHSYVDIKLKAVNEQMRQTNKNS